MNRINNGAKVIRDAEQALQRLLADAATDGDYKAVPVLADWAQQLGSLVDDEDAQFTTQSVPPPGKASKSTKKSSKKKRSSGYPKFVRDEDNLIKIGWSKSDRCEYEHKARKDVVRAVVASISRAGGRGRRFTMEAVLPLKKLDGSSIPDYQSYLILAWLRSTDLVKQHGRLGYTIPQDVDLVEAVENCWTRLANRSPGEAKLRKQGK